MVPHGSDAHRGHPCGSLQLGLRRNSRRSPDTMRLYLRSRATVTLSAALRANTQGFGATLRDTQRLTYDVCQSREEAARSSGHGCRRVGSFRRLSRFRHHPSCLSWVLRTSGRISLASSSSPKECFNPPAYVFRVRWPYSNLQEGTKRSLGA
jgi:hypothetical protein